MFGINRYGVTIYLKSGQIMKATVSSYEAKESPESIVSYKFEKLIPGISLPIEQIAAISYRKPLHFRLWNWLIS